VKGKSESHKISKITFNKT